MTGRQLQQQLEEETNKGKALRNQPQKMEAEAKKTATENGFGGLFIFSYHTARAAQLLQVLQTCADVLYYA